MIKRVLTQQYVAIFIVSAFFVGFSNRSFFSRFTDVYPLEAGNILFVISAALFLFFCTVFIFSVVAHKYTTKPMLILAVWIAAVVDYYSTTYGTVFDTVMFQNMLESDAAEAMALFNYKFLMMILLLGVLPTWLIWRANLDYRSLWVESRAKLVSVTVCLALSGALLFTHSAQYASFFREFKSVRYYTNPIYPIYSAVKYVSETFKRNIEIGDIRQASTDSKIVEEDDTHASELIIMVVGETARADHFQLLGYDRNTNPLLSQNKRIVAFDNVYSCGTSTAVSVPCMFSIEGRDTYEDGDIYRQHNVLDVLSQAGVSVLWRDNNSSSKGVANRVEYQNYRTRQSNTICDEECRDTGMLVGLQDYINDHFSQDILIVLHSYGSHGPEYSKRHPKEFAGFMPECKGNQLGDCSAEEVVNAYDNTILYTDYFLNEIIKLLKKNDDKFETAMFYISDHGESLGESGIYLHGLPYFFAPDAQKRVPALFWLGENSDVSLSEIQKNKSKLYSHDNVFCTLLSLFEVETKTCVEGTSLTD